MALLTNLLAHVHPAWEDFGVFEWVVTGAAALFVAWSIWKAVSYTLHPGEEEPDHPKRIIFGEPPPDVSISSVGSADPADDPSR